MNSFNYIKNENPFDDLILEENTEVEDDVIEEPDTKSKWNKTCAKEHTVNSIETFSLENPLSYKRIISDGINIDDINEMIISNTSNYCTYKIYDFILKHIDNDAVFIKGGGDSVDNDNLIYGIDNEIYYPMGDRIFIDIKDTRKKENFYNRLKNKLINNEVTIKGDNKLIEIVI